MLCAWLRHIQTSRHIKNSSKFKLTNKNTFEITKKLKFKQLFIEICNYFIKYANLCSYATIISYFRIILINLIISFIHLHKFVLECFLVA